jgi:hypothetical protein
MIGPKLKPKLMNIAKNQIAKNIQNNQKSFTFLRISNFETTVT